jgi:glycosyltransferase involved in cell wall biosynthesis
MKSLKLCAVLSIYKNDEVSFIKECIDSLQNQTIGSVFTYICLDGPVSIDVIDLLAQYSNVSIFKNQGNKGLAFSLNRLIKEALDDGYEYIFRMDADDICELNRFEIQMEFMIKNPHVDASGGGVVEFDPLNKAGNITVSYPLSTAKIKNMFPKRCPLAHVTVVFNHMFFSKYGFYSLSTNRNEDFELWLRSLSMGANLMNVSDTLVRVRTSKEFMNRRTGMNKVLNDAKYRSISIRTFGLSFSSYFWVLCFIIYSYSPLFIKRFVSKKIRT